MFHPVEFPVLTGMNFSTTRRKALLSIALLSLTTMMVAKGTETRLRTSLSGGAAASGHADYRASTSPNRARLNVEVEDVNLPTGTKVDVVIDGNQIGTITISAAPIRGGELELNTQDGQAVPSLKSGALVVIKNGDTAILSGVLN